MIITAIYRSGGTKFAIDKAIEHGLEFIGQVDQTAMPDFRRINKNQFHEIGGQADLTFSKLIDVVQNHSKYVILNNAANPALFDQSEFFITRRDIESTFYSLATLMKRQYPGLKAEHSTTFLRTHCYQVGLIHTYLKEKNIVPLYYEDLYPDVRTEYELRNDAAFVDVINENMNLLKKNGVL